jgi:hypothetical protein
MSRASDVKPEVRIIACVRSTADLEAHSWINERPLLALLRHANGIEPRPLSGVTRKTSAHAEFF